MDVTTLDCSEPPPTKKPRLSPNVSSSQPNLQELSKDQVNAHGDATHQTRDSEKPRTSKSIAEPSRPKSDFCLPGLGGGYGDDQTLDNVTRLNGTNASVKGEDERGEDEGEARDLFYDLDKALGTNQSSLPAPVFGSTIELEVRDGSTPDAPSSSNTVVGDRVSISKSRSYNIMDAEPSSDTAIEDVLTSSEASGEQTIQTNSTLGFPSPQPEEGQKERLVPEQAARTSNVTEGGLRSQTANIQGVKTETIIEDGETQVRALNGAGSVATDSRPRMKEEILEKTSFTGARDAGQAPEASDPSREGSEAEFETDSSPYASSSDDSNDSSEDSSDSSSKAGSDDDYRLLDPAEQARRLLEDDAGSDDGGGKKVAPTGQIRTANEKLDEPVEIPDIKITPDMEIQELGSVDTIVESIALIKAKTTGEFQVLDVGSLLCLENRSVVGTIAETMGRVQEPRYCIRFTDSEAMTKMGITKGATVCYVPSHSTFVFTQAIKGVKGSDASNIHDEEVGADEVEFSDDEAEAECKRARKMSRQTKRGGRGDQGNSRGRGAFSGNRPEGKHPPNSSQSREEDMGLKYEDGETNYEPYKRLSRPSNLHEMMGQGSAGAEHPQENYSRRARGGCGRADFGRGRRGRNRFDRQSDQNGRPQSGSSNLDLSLPPTPKFAVPQDTQPWMSRPTPHPASPTPPNQHSRPPMPGLPAPSPTMQYNQPPFMNHLQMPPTSQWNSNSFQSNRQGWPFQVPQQPQHGHSGQLAQHQAFTQQHSPAASPPLPPGSFVNPAFFASQHQNQQFGQR